MSREGIYDIHCHIVPGVDDGSANYEETKKLLHMEYDRGGSEYHCNSSFPVSNVRDTFE